MFDTVPTYFTACVLVDHGMAVNCAADINHSLFASIKRLDKAAIDDHLLGEAVIDTFFLVHIELFLLEWLDTVIEALGTCVEKESRRGLKIDEPSVGTSFHIINFFKLSIIIIN